MVKGSRMEKVVVSTDIEELKENEIIGDVKLVGASIEFIGINNIFCCKKGITLENCKLRFTGNNSLIYIDENEYPISINVRVGNDSVFYFGKRNYTNKTSNFYATERKNIIIGNECLFSFDSYFRTADPHIIYSTLTYERVNKSKSILIGDHVWIGQRCLVLKGTQIGSGAILGGGTIIGGKKVNSNNVFAGNPAKKVKEHVFYSNPKSTHDYTEKDIEDNKIFDKEDMYVYFKDRFTIDMSKLDACISEIKKAKDKMRYIEVHLGMNANKNRFFV